MGGRLGKQARMRASMYPAFRGRQSKSLRTLQTVGVSNWRSRSRTARSVVGKAATWSLLVGGRSLPRHGPRGNEKTPPALRLAGFKDPAMTYFRAESTIIG